MNIKDIPWKEIADKAETARDNGLTNWKFANALQTISLDHLLPIFSSVKLYGNENKISATKTFKNIPNVIHTPNGDIPKEIVLSMLKAIYNVPRSKLISKSLTKNPRFGTWTPIFMYAHKLNNNIKYEAWDKKDEMLKYFLGSGLEWILEPIPFKEYSDEEFKEARIQALTVKSSGELKPATAYKCNLASIKVLNEAWDESSPKITEECEAPWGHQAASIDYQVDEWDQDKYEIIHVPKGAIMMLLQLWLGNASIRDTSGAMILDPYNWDKIPKARDVVISNKTNKPW